MLVRIFTLSLLLLSTILNAQTWNGKQAAVVLTYDDALNVHHTNALPALNKYGLKATFYISDYFDGLRAQIPGWRKAAANGHELGNHTVYHPCLGNLPGRSFVKPETDMNNYSIARIRSEIKTMNTLLKAIDGKNERTFAYPCSDMKIRDTFYLDGVKNEFVAARAVRSESQTIDKIDLYNISCYAVNGESGEKLIELVKEATAKKSLIVFLFHGVGGEHSLNVSLEAHTKLLQYLSQQKNNLWIAPMIDVSKYIHAYQKRANRL